MEIAIALGAFGGFVGGGCIGLVITLIGIGASSVIRGG